MAMPIIHTNGFPGIGKLTIARKLVDLLKHFNAKLVHNHLLIDPAGGVLARSSADYQPLRRAIRTVVFDTLATSPDTYDSIYVFTDAQSNDDTGSSVMIEYRSLVAHRNCALVPIILTCSKEENLKRLGTTERSVHGKLTDLELLPSIWDSEVIYQWPDDPLQMKLDHIELDADEAA